MMDFEKDPIFLRQAQSYADILSSGGELPPGEGDYHSMLVKRAYSIISALKWHDRHHPFSGSPLRTGLK